jgi:HAD superfamily hydrolase (TIGR01509 family)
MSATAPVGLVIFDCDGTLVNSEALNNSVTAAIMAENGAPQYDLDYCLNHFAGIRLSEIIAMVEERHNLRFAPDAVEQYASRVTARMPQELTAVKQALETVRTIATRGPVCVATNGERGNVLKSLSLTGIADIVPEERVFTANMVKHAKPAPDLFLYAAEKMGVHPDRCLVIEDSVFGVQAAQAAGMRVLGFTGVHHDPDHQAGLLKRDGAMAIIQTLPEIIAFL